MLRLTAARELAAFGQRRVRSALPLANRLVRTAQRYLLPGFVVALYYFFRFRSQSAPRRWSGLEQNSDRQGHRP